MTQCNDSDFLALIAMSPQAAADAHERAMAKVRRYEDAVRDAIIERGLPRPVAHETEADTLVAYAEAIATALPGEQAR